ncbi:MAG: metallophosphoesterase [Candidatus Acidiferrales bacterium]
MTAARTIGRTVREAPARDNRKRIVVALVLAALVLFFAYSLWIEPFRVEIVHTSVQGNVATPLKIAQLSDLHTHGVGARERRVLDILDDEKPDVIVVTGDSLGGYGGTYAMVQEVFQQLHAPLGVWVVRGHYENWRQMQHEHSFYANAGVHLLLNSGTLLRNDVWLAGVDDPYTGKPSIEGALTGAPPGVYEILLFHSPAYFDRVAGHVDLCLAGHTHGGQVRPPFCPPLWLPKGCWPYVAGWYEAKGTRSKMYVNRGMGTSLLPIRFNSRPEVTILTVEPDTKTSPN